MNIASIDCGTTNTRVYIIHESGEILGKGTKGVGVRDTSISGNTEILKNGIVEAFYNAIASAHLEIADIQFAISAGMITSEIGLLEIPHLWAPVGIKDLASHMVKVEDASILPIPIPIYFIPGIKNRFSPDTISLDKINSLDFMRGEEAQVAGILRNGKSVSPQTIVILSSHTKFISVDAENRICGSLTTLSGQIFAAIMKETSIGKSLSEGTNKIPDKYLDPQVIRSAFACVEESGFLRTLLMGRFMDVLLHTEWYERRLFIEAAIASEDMKALGKFGEMGFLQNTTMILVGSLARCRIYEYLLKNQLGWKGKILSMSDTDEIDQLNIQGSLYLAEEAGLM